MSHWYVLNQIISKAVKTISTNVLSASLKEIIINYWASFHCSQFSITGLKSVRKIIETNKVTKERYLIRQYKNVQ